MSIRITPDHLKREAAILASDQVERSRKEIIAAVERELEVARYEVSLAARLDCGSGEAPRCP